MLCAQEFHVVSSSSGLKNSTVNAIAKDHAGIVWLGTKSGLYKYNEGQSKEVIFEEVGSKNVQSLLFTSDSILLVGFENGGFLAYDTESRAVLNDTRFPPIDADFAVVSFYEDTFNNIWLGSVGNGIKRLEKDSKDWIDIEYDQKPSNFHSCFDFAQQGDTLWLATAGDEILYYLYSSKKVAALKLSSYNLSSFRKSVDVESGKVVFAIESLGALEINGGKSILHNFPCRDAVYFNQELWISTDGAGLIQCRNEQYKRFTKNDLNTTLITNQYYGFFKDESFLWVGTYNAGAAVYLGDSSVVSRVNLPSSPNPSAINSVVSLQGMDSTVYVGYDGEGAFIYNGNEILPFQDPSEKNSISVVTSILVDTLSKDVWIGSSSQGISIYDGQGRLKNRYRPYTEGGLGLVHGGIWSLEKGRADTVWVGTLEGLQVWDGERFEAVKKQGWRDKKDVVNDILQDHYDTWVAIGKEVVHISSNEVHTSVFSSPVLDLALWKNHVFVSTEGSGVFVLNKKNYSIKHVESKEISTSYAMTTCGERMVLTTNSGLYELDLNDSLFVVNQLMRIQDLDVGEFNRKTILGYKEGLLIGGTKGLYFFDLNKEMAPLPEHFIIDKIFIDNTAYPLPSRSFSSNSHSILDIEKGQNTVQIDFELVSPFKKFDKSIQYVLDGTVVTVSGQSRSFTLTNLSPGRHELSIQLITESGAVLSAVDFLINRKAKFYQFAAFQFLTLIAFLVLISILVVFNLQKRKREIRIQLLETEKKLLASRASESKALLDKRNTELEFQLMKTSNRVEILREFKLKFTEILKLSSNSSNIESSLRDVQRTLDRELKNETYWDGLQDKYYRINDDFVSKVKSKFPQLTKGDLDFILLLRKNLSSKEIAALLNITVYAVRKRKYRIKKKLNLSTDDNLMNHFQSISPK